MGSDEDEGNATGSQAESYSPGDSVTRTKIEKFVKEDTKLYGTPREKNPWNRTFVTVELPDGTYAHVFVD